MHQGRQLKNELMKVWKIILSIFRAHATSRDSLLIGFLSEPLSVSDLIDPSDDTWLCDIVTKLPDDEDDEVWLAICEVFSFFSRLSAVFWSVLALEDMLAVEESDSLERNMLFHSEFWKFTSPYITCYKRDLNFCFLFWNQDVVV